MAFFDNLAHTSGKTNQIFMKFYPRCIFRQGSPH